jgi:hypothetical protein
LTIPANFVLLNFVRAGDTGNRNIQLFYQGKERKGKERKGKERKGKEKINYLSMAI